MTKRSQWNEFDKETRKYIKKRDKNKCVICGRTGALQIMHIFLSRAKGGKGSKENGCLGCIRCHKIIDNPIGKEENILSQKYMEFCKKYLKQKENIADEKELIKTLKFDKSKYIAEISKIKPLETPKATEPIKYTNRCKHCCMLVKNKNNSTIPTYYCKYKKIRLNKTTKACNKFRRN